MTDKGWLVLIRCDFPIPRYWLGWWALHPSELVMQLTLTCRHPVKLLWAQPGEEEEEEELTYPVIQYWLPDTDWFELPQFAVDEICSRAIATSGGNNDHC